jgi:nitrate reductase NapE component
MHTKSNIEKRNTREKFGVKFFLFAVFLLFSFSANAQCAMCRAALEGEGNAAKAEAVNDGIVYLMLFPYLLVAVIGYVIYRTGKNLKKKKEV